MTDPINASHKFCFVHIPKTAGTSFRSMLEHHFMGEEMYPRRADRLKREDQGYPPNKSYRELSAEELASVKIFVGHFPYVFGTFLSTDLEMLTFLREPTSRFLSQIMYTHHMRKMKSPQLTIEETYEDIKAHAFNLQTRFFADQRGQNLAYYNGKKALDEVALEQAKENLAACGFVGISARFTESICHIEKKYGWKLGKIRRVNKTKSSESEKLPDAILRAVADATAYDDMLYRYALTLFEAQKKPPKTYIFLRELSPW